MSPNADLLFKRCARISAPAMPLSQTHPTLPRLRPSLLLPLPPPLVPLFAITQCTMTTHGPPSCKSIHIQTLNRTVHHPSSLTISMSMSSTRTNNNNNLTTTTTITNNNNNKIQPRVSLPSNQPSVVQPLIPSLITVVNYSPLKVTSPSSYSSPPYTIYNHPNPTTLPSLLSPLPSQHPGYVAPGLVSGASMFY